MKKLTPTHKMMNRAVLALAVIFISLNGLAMAARAERGGWHDHARAAHEWRQNHWHNGRMVYGDRELRYLMRRLLLSEPPPPVYYGAGTRASTSSFH